MILFSLSLLPLLHAFYLSEVERHVIGKGYEIFSAVNGSKNIFLESQIKCSVKLEGKFVSVAGDCQLYRLNTSESAAVVKEQSCELEEGKEVAVLVAHNLSKEYRSYPQLQKAVRNNMKGVVVKLRLRANPMPQIRRGAYLAGQGMFLLFLVLLMVAYFMLLNYPREFGRMMNSFNGNDIMVPEPSVIPQVPNVISQVPVSADSENVSEVAEGPSNILIGPANTPLTQMMEIFCDRIGGSSPFTNFRLRWQERDDDEIVAEVFYMDLERVISAIPISPIIAPNFHAVMQYVRGYLIDYCIDYRTGSVGVTVL